MQETHLAMLSPHMQRMSINQHDSGQQGDMTPPPHAHPDLMPQPPNWSLGSPSSCAGSQTTLADNPELRGWQKTWSQLIDGSGVDVGSQMVTTIDGVDFFGTQEIVQEESLERGIPHACASVRAKRKRGRRGSRDKNKNRMVPAASWDTSQVGRPPGLRLEPPVITFLGHLCNPSLVEGIVINDKYHQVLAGEECTNITQNVDLLGGNDELVGLALKCLQREQADACSLFAGFIDLIRLVMYING